MSGTPYFWSCGIWPSRRRESKEIVPDIRLLPRGPAVARRRDLGAAEVHIRQRGSTHLGGQERGVERPARRRRNGVTVAGSRERIVRVAERDGGIQFDI